MKLGILYSGFALIAIACNIIVQDISYRVYQGPFAITLSMILGTLAGLIVKYTLDKTYIFQFRTKNLAHESQTFSLYTLMGLFTTAIFWGFEWGFHFFFHTPFWRYIGAIIGLTLGYLIKYHLDKHFVFKYEHSVPRQRYQL